MVYTIQEISRRIMPVAEKYHIPAVYMFGSYARGTATDDSNVDIIMDTIGTDIKGIETVDAMLRDLELALEKKVTVVTTQSLEEEPVMASDIEYRENILRDKVLIYTAK